MKSVKAVILGHNKWDEYTYPLIVSLWKYAIGLDIYVVDNGSDPEYPTGDGYTIIRSDNHSVARGLNTGIELAGDADWYLSLDNDTTCTAPFLDVVNTLDKNIYYGAKIKDWEVLSYVVGFCRLISRKIYQAVGPHDELFSPWGYTDADYSHRVELEGFGIEQIDLPFEHKLHGSHEYLGDIEELRDKNQQKFLDKHGLRLDD